MGYGKIGTRGRNPGPGKTEIKGSIRTGNLGSKTNMRSNTGTNKAPEIAITRRPRNAGRGGTQSNPPS